MVVRSHQMAGKDSNYVPGWDCHGLPIEWKVEEEFYRKKGKTKPDFSDPAAIIAFRRECRAYADHWINVQREEFKRLGVIGDWDHPYLTMSYPAEAQIAREIFKFVANGLLYRGSKPVMWSVVEKTALAEAEVEYEDHVSDTIYVAFPVEGEDAAVVIWTTTPWTIPGNRAIAYSRRIAYGRYRVTEAPPDNWAKVGSTYILADSLAEGVFNAAKVAGYERVGDVASEALAEMVCAHPLHRLGYGFVVPLLEGDHVTEDAGTGFVHTAPGHGREDFELWMANGRLLIERGLETRIPYTVDADGVHDRRGARLHRPARADRKGREGRRQRRRHQGAGRGRRADRARQAEAPVSAQLAVEEAGDLPQYAAMVSRDGSALRQRVGGKDPARAGSRRHRRDPLGAEDRREPHQGHGRQQARLGAVASARLGRAACDLRAQGRARSSLRRGGQRAHRGGLRKRGRGRMVRRRRKGAFSRRHVQSRRLRQDRQSGRGLVRFRVDARLRPRGSPSIFRGLPASGELSTGVRTR